MNFPIFASVVVFAIWLSHMLSKNRTKDEHIQNHFWEKESLANSMRRKPLDDLDYIHIPLNNLPLHTMTEDTFVIEYIDTITMLNEKSIVNLTGISNTDLKLAYGAPNITQLSEYDHNYTQLVRTLYVWGKKLYETGYINEAKQVLEFGISCHTDISGNYKILADIYIKEDEFHKLDDLIAVAETLNSAMKNSILSFLKNLKDFSTVMLT